MTNKHGLLLILLLLAFNVNAKDVVKEGKGVKVSAEHVFYFPRQIVFWNVIKGNERKNSIFIRQGDNHPVKIKTVKSSSKYIQAKVVKSGGKEYQTYSIDITLKGRAPVGVVDSLITVETDHPKQPEITVPVYWNVLNGMEVDPPAFGVRLTRGMREAGGIIKIASTDGKPFEIEKVNMLLPNTKTDIKPTKKCCGYYIAILVSDPEFNFTKPQESSLIIYTNTAQGIIVVPVMVTAPTFAPPEIPTK